MQIGYNRTAGKREIKYIVVHDTGNPAKGADAMAHYKYINSGYRGASADYFVDERGALKINNYNKYYTWHCGDGHGKNGITNANSIGIEICINSDGNYSKAFDNAASLVKKLMSELGIAVENVVRHYDASGKNCPASMSRSGWSKWHLFKTMIAGGESITMTQYEELKEENKALKAEIENLKKDREKVYHFGNTLPDWAQPTVQKLVDRGIYKGESEGDLNLTETLMRLLVINDRAGVYDR